MIQQGPTSSAEDWQKDLALADRFWCEFHHRNELYWRLFQRAVLFQTALTVVPFSSERYFGSVLHGLWIFPCIAAVVTVVSFLLMRGEAARLSGPGRLYRGRLRRHMTEDEVAEYFIVKTNQKPSLLITIMLSPAGSISKTLPFYWLAYGLSMSAIVLWQLWAK